MNALPSMIVLDFFEWLKNQAKRNHNENYSDMFDLILNEEYHVNLRRYAKEYLRGGGYSFRGLLHRFIDSEEFGDCIRHCHPFFIEEWHHLHKIHPEDIRMFLRQCYHCEKGERAFERFVKRYYNQNSNDLPYRDRITPEMLVDSVEFYVRNHQSEPYMMEFMTVLKTDLSLEVDFLEWLMINKGKPMNLAKMPLSLFESIAEEYCSDVNRSYEDKKKLVKAFKQNDSVSLGKKLVAVLTRTQAQKMKSLGYIFDRYSSERIPFRCFFLPLESDADAFEKFIKKNWADLNGCLEIIWIFSTAKRTLGSLAMK